MKKIITKLSIFYFIFIGKIFSAKALCIEILGLGCGGGSGGGGSAPNVVCEGLPGCSGTTGGKSFFTFLGNLISSGIKYTAVIAVISLILAGMMYLISGGEDEKVKKAKKWITWSLVGVLISTSAWAIINLVNSFKIN